MAKNRNCTVSLVRNTSTFDLSDGGISFRVVKEVIFLTTSLTPMMCIYPLIPTSRVKVS
jgi:hypothetical protein